MRRIAIRIAFGLIASAVLVLAAGGHPAHAATITVTTTADVSADDGLCSLREAVTAANTDTATGGCPAGSGADEIVLSAGTYVRAVGALTVSSEVEITGAGADTTAIDGGAVGTVLINTGTLTVSAVSIQNGRRSMGSAVPAAGGIHNTAP